MHLCCVSRFRDGLTTHPGHHYRPPMTKPADKALASIPATIVIGAPIGALGGAIVSQANGSNGTQLVGILVASFGGAFVQFGIIAGAVSLGMRHRDEWNAAHRED